MIINSAYSNCITGYALSRVIHHIQSEIYFHVNPNRYTAWLGPNDSQCPAYLLNPEPHPQPLSVGNLPPPQELVKCGIKIGDQHC
jgi:hypothetical protein